MEFCALRMSRSRSHYTMKSALESLRFVTRGAPLLFANAAFAQVKSPRPSKALRFLQEHWLRRVC